MDIIFSDNLMKTTNRFHLQHAIEDILRCIETFKRTRAILPEYNDLSKIESDFVNETQVRLQFALDHMLMLTPVYNLDEKFSETIETRNAFWKERSEE